MIGIFLKELRENAKWAAVISALLLIFVWHEIREPESMFLYQFAHHYTLFVAPLAGLLMGVVQSLFETGPDNWAFVVHRPVQRRRIFVAKCAAGLVLLYASLAVPCAVATVWAAQPGHLPMPFQGRMVLPMAADILGAGCWYFVGVVLVLRRARWFGTRLLPLGLVLITSALVTLFIAEFWQVVLILLSVQAIGAAAAWGAFATNGAADASFLTRFALGALIVPGALGVAMALVGMSQSFTPGGHWLYYQIDRDGDVVRVDQRIVRGERTWAVTDVDGRPLPKYEGIDLDDPANANRFIRFSAAMLDESSVPWPLDVEYMDKGYRHQTAGVIGLRAVAPPGVRLRFNAIYDVPRRLIDLYDSVTRVSIGTVGPDGFAPRGSPARSHFPGTPVNLFSQGGRHVMAFESIAYWVELDKRRVRPVFTTAADDPIFSAAEIGPATDPIIVLATTRMLHVIRPDGKELFATPLPVPPGPYFFQPAWLADSSHLILQAMPAPGHDGLRRVVLEYSTDGKLLRRTEPPRLPEPRGAKLHETALFGAIFPLGARPLVPTWMLDDFLDVRSAEFAGVFEGFMLASAICCAAFSILIARRFGFRCIRTLGCGLTGLLLGPAGVVALLGVNEWPARELCAACGRKRIAAHRECSRCAAIPPAPEVDGREIFEPCDVVQAVG